MTLLELMIAMTILVMVVGAMGFLAKGVEQGFQYTEGHDAATQHARITLERIAKTVREAAANEDFPGILVVAETIGTWEFPDALVVWREDTSGDDQPQFDELVVFCPDATAPNKLVEITMPTDTRNVPAASDQSTWQKEIEAIKRSDDRESVLLTGLLRVCSVEGADGPALRGAVRFVSRLRPSQDEWDTYVGKGRALDHWKQLSWVQGIYGTQTGLRQAWVAIELQLMPGEKARLADSTGRQAIPFPGSAALYYEMHR